MHPFAQRSGALLVVNRLRAEACRKGPHLAGSGLSRDSQAAEASFAHDRHVLVVVGYRPQRLAWCFPALLCVHRTEDQEVASGVFSEGVVT